MSMTIIYFMSYRFDVSISMDVSLYNAILSLSEVEFWPYIHCIFYFHFCCTEPCSLFESVTDNEFNIKLMFLKICYLKKIKTNNIK